MLRKTLWSAFVAAKGYPRYWGELGRFSKLNPYEQKLELAKRLQAQIRYFGSREDALPEWRAAARIPDPLELWDCWPQLPIVTKEMLRTRFNARELAARAKFPGIVSSTGGSTGEPVHYFLDNPTVVARTAVHLYALLRMGWRLGMPTVCAWGSERDIGGHRSLRGQISGYLKGSFVVDGYKLGTDTVEKVVRLIQRHSPVALYGFTSILEFIARQILKSGIDLPDGSVSVAWNGGEMLFPEQARIFRKAFKVPINNLYGGREIGALAHQVGAAGPLHLLRPEIFIEIVDESGKPSAPGQAGRVIATSMRCRGTPFLRYDIGDMAAFSSADCDDSGLHALSELHGRAAGLLALPNGKVINCLYWNHLLKEFTEIHQFQVVFRKAGTIDLLLTGDGLRTERASHLDTVLKRFLCEVPVRVNWVERIPVTREGKLVQVVRE